jgi:hypothetical protein
MALLTTSQTRNSLGGPQTDLIAIAQCVLAQHTRPHYMPHHLPQFTKLELIFIWTIPIGVTITVCIDISSQTQRSFVSGWKYANRLKLKSVFIMNHNGSLDSNAQHTAYISKELTTQ